jgi:hypothetical protein
MPRQSKARLDQADLSTIVGMIETWNGALTWEALVERVELAVGRPFTRQALDGHASIKLAFQARKERLRNIRASLRAGRAPDGDVPAEMTVLLQRAEALQGRVDTLEALIRAYEAKFVTWLHNARGRGISEEVLNAPLPPIDRAADVVRKVGRR